MAISERIKAEARRTIDGIERYYAKYGADIEDSEEKEHRIARIEAAMEGCNGLSQEDKVQKTAENVFELTCAQERSFDTMRKELKDLRDENNQEFDLLRGEMKSGLQNVIKAIEDSGMDSSSSQFSLPYKKKYGSFMKIISDHPLLAFNTFIFVLLLVFVSGHFEALYKLFGIE